MVWRWVEIGREEERKRGREEERREEERKRGREEERKRGGEEERNHSEQTLEGISFYDLANGA